MKLAMKWLKRQKTTWADQAADRRAMSTVLMLLSPVVVDGSASLPELMQGVKDSIIFLCCKKMRKFNISTFCSLESDEYKRLRIKMFLAE